jgi:hypothetical protein
VVEEAGETVVGGAPEGQIRALLYDLQLVHEGCGEFSLVGLEVASYFCETFRFHLTNAVFDIG